MKKSIGYLLMFLILIMGLMSACTTTDTANALQNEVTTKEAYQLREDGAFVLDVREPDEWETGHIPGATLIPLGELESRVSELPQDQPIVVVCRSGNRSATGRDILLSAGFTQVTSMAGGMNMWSSANYEVEGGP